MKNNPHFKLLVMDETHHWSDAVVKKAGRLHGVYLVDVSEHTYACELRPSYCAYFLHTIFDAPGLSDEELDELDQCILMHDSPMGEVSYFHVSGIKDFAHDLGTSDNFKHYIDDCDGDEENAYTLLLDEMLEYCTANHHV